MAKESNKVELTISDDELLEALRRARKIDFLDNLRHRNQFVKLDCLVRGYLGEICFRRWLSEQGVKINKTNMMTTDEQNIDIDLTLENEHLSDIKLELKTSLIPDRDKNLDEVFANRDIKIIKREQDFHSISTDFHAQIYFNRHTKKRDEDMKSIEGTPTNYTDDELIKIMRLDTLKQVLVAWIDKKSLDTFLENANPKTWTFPNSMRLFWRCPLSTVANNAQELPEAIRKYKRL